MRPYVALFSLVGGLVLPLAVAASALAQAPSSRPALKVRLHEPRLVADFSQVSRVVVRPAPASAEKLATAKERARGPGLTVYPLVAPATVVVSTSHGHGTGFVIDPQGWIITNHHVVADADVDPATRSLRVTVHVGRLENQFMRVIEPGIPALVYKVNQQQDLALLKLSRMPAGMSVLPALRLADAVPPPGSDCIAIGHPARGMLWTLRSGEIAGAGTWPREMIDVVMQRLIATGRDREQLQEILDHAPQRKVVISTCGLNPGDSGGALVNTQGEVVGVSFGIPRTDEGEGAHYDKFSYHVHLDELREFLAHRPTAPAVAVPDPWPAGAYFSLEDLDGDGVPDTLVFAATPRGPITGVLVDLAQSSRLDSDARSSPERLKSHWHFQFALQLLPVPRAFYDTDNGGRINLVLTGRSGDENPEVAEELRLEQGSWTVVKNPHGKLFDPARIQDKALRRRLVAIRDALSGGGHGTTHGGQLNKE
jgi:S1-C subfamily serine protease